MRTRFQVQIKIEAIFIWNWNRWQSPVFVSRKPGFASKLRRRNTTSLRSGEGTTGAGLCRPRLLAVQFEVFDFKFRAARPVILLGIQFDLIRRSGRAALPHFVADFHLDGACRVLEQVDCVYRSFEI